MCYDCRMSRVASRQLRNETRKVLERVSAGENVTITVDGRDVALLTPVPTTQPWITKTIFLDSVARFAADPQLARDLDELTPGTTDDV